MIIGLVIGIILTVVSGFDCASPTVIVIGAIILVLWVMSIGEGKVIREYEEKQYNIQGLESNISTKQETNGAFVLGFGYINSSSSEQIKYYYFKVNDLGKKLETIEIGTYSETYIRETDEIEPCLIYRYQETVNKGFYKWLFGEFKTSTQIAEILVVPKNTIKIEYNVEI